MTSWLETARSNLLRLSQEKDDFQLAVGEWRYTHHVVDYGCPSRTCQLCEHERLRYHFEIQNCHTATTLLVGSSCINQFDIPVHDDDQNPLHGQAKNDRLNQDLRARQEEMVLEPLRQLWIATLEERRLIHSCVEKYKSTGSLCPGNLLFLFQRLNHHGIAYLPQLFKVNLRSGLDRQQLLRMSESELALVWPSLSPPQQRRYTQERQGRPAAQPIAPPPAESPLLPAPRPMPGFYEQRSLPADRPRWSDRSAPATAFEPVEAICTLCSKKTSDWVVYDGKTKTCTCRDCMYGTG